MRNTLISEFYNHCTINRRNCKEDQRGSVTSDVASVTEVVDTEEISDVDDDEGMLAACINIGIQRVM